MLSSEPSCSGVTVKVHPLVVLNLSEHWTRARLQKTESAVWGVILGHKDSKGQEYEAITSFDLQVARKDVQDGRFELEAPEMQARLAQYTEVFKDLTYLGWYTASTPKEDEKLSLPCDSLLFQLAPFINMPANKLPLMVYKINEKGIAQSVQWTLHSEESERIGVEHVTRLSKAAGDISASNVSRHHHTQSSVAGMVYQKLRVVQRWLQAVEAGSIAYDPEIAREAAKIIHIGQQIKPAGHMVDEHLEAHTKEVAVAILITKVAALLGNGYQTVCDALRLREPVTAAAADMSGDIDPAIRMMKCFNQAPTNLPPEFMNL
ncbi:unnamed protein product, partial [Mesorhabditis spiculigera]